MKDASPTSPAPSSRSAAFLAGGGDMSAEIRRLDWSSSPLGRTDDWPEALRTLVSVMLAARQPMFVVWGPERTLLYNDAYVEILAAKHPEALGRPFLEVWSEIRDDLLPIVDQAFAGEPVHMDDITLVMQRRGYPEETHFAFSYTPVRDPAGAVGGFLCACVETTEQVVAERRRQAAETALRAERDRAQGVLDNMGDAFALLDRDFRIVDMNAAAMQLETRPREEIVGKTHWEAYPTASPELGELYRRAMASHEPAALEHRYVWPDGRETWIDMRAFPVGDGLAVFYRDISERKRVDSGLSASEARLGFLDRLGAETAPLADADVILATTTRLVGEHLNLSVCAYADMDADQDGFTIRGDWAAPGSSSIVGHYRLADFGKLAVTNLSAGLSLVVNDNLHELAPEEAATFQSIGITATICMPLVKAGRLTALMAIHDKAPRVWTEAELSLLREVTERSWAHVERVGALAELRESEEFTRRVLASSADCIKVLDLDARLESMSEGGMGVMEVDDFGAIRGAFWPDFWQGDEHPNALAAVEEAKRGGSGRFQGFATTMKGTPRWWDVAVTPINGADGRPEKLLSVSRDITVAKEAEAALRLLNADLERQVIERTQARGRSWAVSPDLMGALNAEGYFETSNPAWDTMLGWSEDEVRRTPIWELLHPDDLELTREGFAQTQLGHAAIQFANRYRCKDDSYRWISWVGVPEDGLVYCTGRDITEEKAREAELALAQEALRQAQKMEAVGQLTGGIAHDFNNLLAGISGSLELIQRRIAQERYTGLERFIDAAQDSSRRAASLTQRLLAFSRRQTLDPKPTNVNKLVFGMEDLIRRTVGPGVAVEVVGAAGLWTALIDPSQLESALLNLAINARDAMPDGGRITIETANKWLDERGARERELPPGQYLSVCVTDSGTGMTRELVDRIFDPFFTTKPIGQGTGLGLSMIHGFVRQSGGQVRVYSEVGKGTTMCLYLPRHLGELAEAETAAEPTIDDLGHGETVLVIDDEPTVRMLIVEVLEEAGYRALEAADGPSGLKVLRSDARIDLLITDVGLPGGMNGRQVADAARLSRPDLKILFVTGFAENAAVGNGHLDPGMQVLTKPFMMSDLANKIADMI